MGTFLAFMLALFGAAPVGAELRPTGRIHSTVPALVAATTSAHSVGAPSGCSATGVGSPASSGGYWVAGADGSVYSCGDAPWSGSLPSEHITPDGPVVSIASCGSGYLLATAAGAVYAFGGIPPEGGAQNVPLTAPIVGIVPTSDCFGYWLVSANGGVFTFGDASFLGSAGNLHLNEHMVGMAAPPEPMFLCRVAGEPCAAAYWLVAADGGVFTYNSPSNGSEGVNGTSASFLGSTGCLTLNRPVVGMAVSPDTTDVGTNTACHSGPLAPGGYWMVASDGGVFAFGNAPFLGSTGCIALNRPIVGMVVSPDPTTVGQGTACLPQGQEPNGSSSLPPGGYTMIASDGGVFSFGNAPFVGSLPGSGISVDDVVGIAPYTAEPT